MVRPRSVPACAERDSSGRLVALADARNEGVRKLNRLLDTPRGHSDLLGPKLIDDACPKGVGMGAMYSRQGMQPWHRVGRELVERGFWQRGRILMNSFHALQEGADLLGNDFVVVRLRFRVA